MGRLMAGMLLRGRGGAERGTEPVEPAGVVLPTSLVRRDSA